jgi:hypothetical protein
VEGRTDDLLHLPGRDGTHRPVHPVVFHRALELLDAAGWQVRQDEDGLTVLVASPGPAFDAAAAQQAVAAGLEDAQVAPLAIRVAVVDAIPTAAAGKRPLIVALPAGTPSSRCRGIAAALWVPPNRRTSLVRAGQRDQRAGSQHEHNESARAPIPLLMAARSTASASCRIRRSAYTAAIPPRSA